MPPPIAPSNPPDRLAELIAKQPPVGLLADPLSYILADHGRQRAACAALLDMAAGGRASRTSAEIVSTFLKHDLRLHFFDEEEDLFPALRQRALPDDDIGPLLERLVADHCRSREHLDAIVDALTPASSADPIRLNARAGEMMQAYSLAEQEHLAIENAIVLPIAQRRLTAGDLRAMSRHMRERRGVIN